VSKIEIYTKDYCPYCRRAKDLLDRKGVKYQERDVTQDRQGQIEMQKRSERKTVPQIFVDGKHIGDCDEIHALDAQGKLDAILGIGRKEQKMSSSDSLWDVIIIGSGPAGYTSAIYASRANLKTLMIAGVEAGGQLMTTTDVENYPGFPQGIQGPEMMELFKKQTERFGTQIIPGDATEVRLKERPFRVRVGEVEHQARAIIVSTGASAKWMGLPSEQKYRGKGVSACATCDGFFFRNQVVAVMGGGDTAMEEALFLTKHASKVYVLHRRNKLRASKIMQDRAFKNSKIEFIWDTVVDEVLGDGKAVTGLRLKNVKTGKTSELSCQGFFVAIGHKPNTDLFKGELDMNEVGYLKTYKGTVTNISGVFAAGDVQDAVYRQAVTAAGSGCMAAIDAERYLESLGH
jgi:thioredoxin reductase (NADPH)